MEPITLHSMGEALHISSYYLSHVFKQMSGYSPVQYLLRRRIGEAQTLLITTDLSITRIAEMVGYDTQSYFNLQFTKNVGHAAEQVPPELHRAQRHGGKAQTQTEIKSLSPFFDRLRSSFHWKR